MQTRAGERLLRQLTASMATIGPFGDRSNLTGPSMQNRFDDAEKIARAGLSDSDPKAQAMLKRLPPKLINTWPAAALPMTLLELCLRELHAARMFVQIAREPVVESAP